MSSCWELPRADFHSSTRGYGHLAEGDLKDWASDDADLSIQFKDGTISRNSDNKDRSMRKCTMMKRIEVAFSQRASAEVYGEYRDAYQQLFDEKLEDPGLLHNFEYFNIPSSDFMLMFYISMWTGKMADAMVYLHNYGWDLKKVFRKVPANDVWFQMSFYEAMNINERIKAQSVVDKIDSIVAKKSFADDGGYRIAVHATAFAGGNLPERLYGTSDGRGARWIGNQAREPEDLHLTVFDNGDVRSMEELYPDGEGEFVEYIHESFEDVVKHPELHGTQDLVWMHGLSMYLGPKVPDALQAGFVLLNDSGEMMYDYLIMTESLRRCLATQGWPIDAKYMHVQKSVNDAYLQAQRDVAAFNLRMRKAESLFEIEKLEITEVYPWGATSLRVTLRKYQDIRNIAYSF
ncbi:hypothetical protein J6S39_01485 [Candidatus Saccharibacteria bacterium]|nr:hypothetical protein [Candidatus Saccharibacteria bacterium]